MHWVVKAYTDAIMMSLLLKTCVCVQPTICCADVQKLLACRGFDSVVTASTLHDAFLPIHADPLKAKLAAVSALQRILPCQSSVVPIEH